MIFIMRLHIWKKSGKNYWKNRKKDRLKRSFCYGGEGGVRTLARFHVCRFSKPVPSAAWVPGDTDDIKREYEILLNELRNFNPEMLDKHRVLAVTKADLLDDELIEMLRETVPDDIPVVFISSVAGKGLNELKDVLWRELNSESNKLLGITAEDTLVHRDKDMSRFQAELAAEGEDFEYVDEDELEDVDDIEDFEDFEYEEVEK